MTLIHTRHRSTRIINQHREDSQLEAINMNDMIVVNCYRGQTTNIETFIDDIHQNIDPNQGQPMLCIGDFNTHVANFSAEDQGQTFYVNNDKGEPIPSRWQGTRCIDFALAYNTKCDNKVTARMYPFWFLLYTMVDLNKLHQNNGQTHYLTYSRISRAPKSPLRNRSGLNFIQAWKHTWPQLSNNMRK